MPGVDERVRSSHFSPTVRGMGRVYLFADETGNFDFSGGPGASRYFGVGTLLLDETAAGTLRADLHALRDSMAWQELGLQTSFHAAEDSWPVRAAVLSVLARRGGRVDVTLLDKRRISPHVGTDIACYAEAWRQHLSRTLPTLAGGQDDVMVVAAQIGTRRRRARFRSAVEQALAECGTPLGRGLVAAWPASSDPCLWAADYCVWAVGRKWERGDRGPAGVIAHRLASERAVRILAVEGGTPPD